MEMLVNADVYKRVRVYDFQAACPQSLSLTSPANFLLTVLVLKFLPKLHEKNGGSQVV